MRCSISRLCCHNATANIMNALWDNLHNRTTFPFPYYPNESFLLMASLCIPTVRMLNRKGNLYKRKQSKGKQQKPHTVYLAGQGCRPSSPGRNTTSEDSHQYVRENTPAVECVLFHADKTDNVGKKRLKTGCIHGHLTSAQDFSDPTVSFSCRVACLDRVSFFY